MSRKMDKKIRRAINKKTRLDMEDLAQTLSEARLYWRIVYAIRLIFKWNPKVKTITKPERYYKGVE
jgi:hypothetical protein